MIKMDHSSEPWVWKPMGGDSIVLATTHKFHRCYPQTDLYPIAVPRIYQVDGETVWDSSAGFTHADANRIVACVNACEGIATSTLRRGQMERLIRTVNMFSTRQS